MKIAIVDIVFGFFFSDCDSSSANGSAKCSNNKRKPDPSPAAIQTPDIPGDLLRQIARIDDQILRELQIRPQHHERQHQLAQIVQMLLREQRGSIGAYFAEKRQHRNHHATSPISPVPSRPEIHRSWMPSVASERHQVIDGANVIVKK